MKNLVEKYTAETVEVADEEGLVAIEYVVMAGVLIGGLTVLAWTGVFTALTGKLTTLINSI